MFRQTVFIPRYDMVQNPVLAEKKPLYFHSQLANVPACNQAFGPTCRPGNRRRSAAICPSSESDFRLRRAVTSVNWLCEEDRESFCRKFCHRSTPGKVVRTLFGRFFVTGLNQGAERPAAVRRPSDWCRLEQMHGGKRNRRNRPMDDERFYRGRRV